MSLCAQLGLDSLSPLVSAPQAGAMLQDIPNGNGKLHHDRHLEA